MYNCNNNKNDDDNNTNTYTNNTYIGIFIQGNHFSAKCTVINKGPATKVFKSLRVKVISYPATHNNFLWHSEQVKSEFEVQAVTGTR